MLAEIRETEAPPDVAAIYAEIRESTGLPLVNLGWRHFAALPGVLPWLWERLGPLYRSGAVGAAAARLRAGLGDAALGPISAGDLEAAGLPAGERARLGAMLAVYNRGNSFNLVGFGTMLEHLRAPVGGTPRSHAPMPPPPVLPPLPPLPRLDELAPPQAEAVRRLAALHRDFPADAVPSLYLHFACWPELPALVETRLAPFSDAGDLAASARRLGDVARNEARALAADLPRTPAPEGCEVALARFATGPIQQLIVVGNAIQAALTT